MIRSGQEPQAGSSQTTRRCCPHRRRRCSNSLSQARRRSRWLTGKGTLPAGNRPLVAGRRHCCRRSIQGRNIDPVRQLDRMIRRAQGRRNCRLGRQRPAGSPHTSLHRGRNSGCSGHAPECMSSRCNSQYSSPARTGVRCPRQGLAAVWTGGCRCCSGIGQPYRPQQKGTHSRMPRSGPYRTGDRHRGASVCRAWACRRGNGSSRNRSVGDACGVRGPSRERTG